MCLIVTREKNSTWVPTLEEQSNAWQSNPHGFGAGWINRKGRLVFQKTMEEKEVEKIIASIPEGSPFILHWRLATHGDRSVRNCHPFPCLGNSWLAAHNGILSKQPLVEGLTDSESYLRTLKGTEPNLRKVEKDIARLGYGKIAFLSGKGEIRIANEAEGEWREDTVWQSNGGLDSVPWYSSGFGGWRPTIGLSARAIRCDACLTHAPLYRSGNMYLCADCATEQEGGEWIR